jgi:hypothetical protein
MRGRDHLEDVDIDVKIILKLIFNIGIDRQRLA